MVRKAAKLAQQEEAHNLIALKLAEVDILIRECEKIALDAGVCFTFESPCGRQESFDGDGSQSDDWENSNAEPSKWDHSQC